MGLFRKLFSGSVKKGKDFTMTIQMAEKIIQDYGVVLQTQAPTPGCVSDADNLPYPKEKIKKALIIGLKSTQDPKMKEFLKIGYLQLADWQDGVGASDQGIDLSNLNLDNDPMKLAQSILDQNEDQEKWTHIVLSERETLERELRNLGLW
jgi:hypothetical protein